MNVYGVVEKYMLERCDREPVGRFGAEVTYNILTPPPHTHTPSPSPNKAMSVSQTTRVDDPRQLTKYQIQV